MEPPCPTLDWNQRMASSLVTRCCTPTLASCRGAEAEGGRARS